MSTIKEILHEKREATEKHIQLIAGILYLCGNGFHHVLDYIALIALAAVISGVAYIIYLNKIHQKNFSFGLIVYAGLAGAIIGIV